MGKRHYGAFLTTSRRHTMIESGQVGILSWILLPLEPPESWPF
jgi:hypothetical protein